MRNRVPKTYTKKTHQRSSHISKPKSDDASKKGKRKDCIHKHSEEDSAKGITLRGAGKEFYKQ